MMSMYVDTDQKNWDLCLPYIQMAYNTSKQASTHYTPFFLAHGREATLPQDVATVNLTAGLPLPTQGYVKATADFLRAAQDLARENITKTQETQKRNYDKCHRNVTFHVGDLVLVFSPRRIKGRAEKLLHCYQGPFKITARKSPLVYEVVNLLGREKVEVVHVSRLKPYTERAPEPSAPSVDPEESDSDASLDSNISNRTHSDTELYELPWYLETNAE